MITLFESVEKSIELAKQGVTCDSGFSYMYNCEETDFDTFDLNGDIEAQLAQITENGDWMLKVAQDIDQPFDEFTATVCPAYPKDKPISITINAEDYTPTELLTETQRLNFRDPAINTHLIALLRKIADGMEKHEVGIYRLSTKVEASARQFPMATIEFDFTDRAHFDKYSKRQDVK